MSKVSLITSRTLLLIIGCLTVIWNLTKGKNKRLEIQYYLIGIVGAVVFGRGLHLLFSHLATGKMLSKTFPSEQTLISIVILGFFMYVILRHSQSAIINISVVILEMSASCL